MRRYIVSALLSLFILQSSGAAFANSPGDANTRVSAPSLASIVSPLLSAIEGSQILAELTGSENRYAAMHAPAPRINKPITTVNAASLITAEHPLRPIIRVGVPDHVTMPPLSSLNRRHRQLDPLAMRRSATPVSAPKPNAGSLIEPLRSLAIPQKTHPAMPARQQRNSGPKPMTSSSLGTGIEHWWTYEEHAVPGIGKAMVNVGTGNLVVTAMDVDIPERGIDLAFQRVYNSQSLHDYNGDDGGDSAIFGNLWTNTFDANMVYNSTANTITVYDIDGTGCTYTSDGNGGWVPCTGEYATLATTDPQTDCTYAWTKKNGTVYWFHADDNGNGTCGIAQAKKGHLQEILGRNNNNNITFTYSYAGTGKSAENVTEIDANHSDGQELVMKFGQVGTNGPNELATVTRPDGGELQYLYDTSGNLLRVDKPGNNTPTPTAPQGSPSVPTGDLPETYAYVSGTSGLQEACGPRCTIANWAHPANPNDGAALVFALDSSLRLASWQVQGKLNFTPSDGTNTVLQSGSTSFQAWFTEYFLYGSTSGSPCGNTSSGTTTMCDTDGHSIIWTTDASSRVTQTQEWTGPSDGIWIVSNQTWDANNNMTSSTDPAGNITKYGYDGSPGSVAAGNLVEEQLPYTGDILGGAIKPISYYSYDSYNNVIAYCDAVYNANHGNGWVSQPTDNLCPSAAGATYFSFLYSDGNEPFGRLTDMYMPSGYHHSITYDQTVQGGDFGLPTEVQGDQITQYDNSTRKPTQDLGYDSLGNLNSYDRGFGGGSLQDSWAIAYSNVNLATKHTENDATINPSGISSFSCYYPDGTLLYTETPSQHAADGNPTCPTTATLLQGSFTSPPNATSYNNDADGDQTETFTHKGCSSATPCPANSSSMACSPNEQNPIGTTCKYYDGLDRLVDVIEPYDNRTIPNSSVPYEFYGFKWLTRYIYDLSQSGASANLTISDNTGTISNINAFGGLYKTQECLPNKKIISSPASTCSWSDVRGSSFDAEDRVVSKYELAFGTAAQLTNTYDTNGNAGLLSETKNAVGQKMDYMYDALNKVKQIAFSGTAPLADNRTYQYDADGRIATAQNSLGTLTNTYDLDGNKISVAEAPQEAAASLICYTYYGDGLREYVSIGPVSVGGCKGIVSNMNPGNGGISQPDILSYAYRLDGKLTTEHVNWSVQSDFTWTFAPSGRELTQTDPLNGQQVSSPIPPTNITIAPKTYTYDGNGRVQSLTLPEGFAALAMSYDTDDELVGYNASFNGTSYARQLALSARGELALDNLPNTQFGWNQGPTSYANGTQFGDGNSTQNGVVQAPPTTLQFDVRSGMVTGSTDPQWALGLTGVDLFTYDGAGRKVSRSYAGSLGGGGSLVSNSAFDAENHFQSSTFSDGITTSATAQYGADQRERVDKIYDSNNPHNPPTVQTAHWDGDSILFDTSTASNGLALYVGKIATLDQYGDWTIIDRDQTGTQQTEHGISVSANFPPQGTWYRGWDVGNTRTRYIIKRNYPISYEVFYGSCGSSVYQPVGPPLQEPNCPGSGGIFPMQRSDGYGMASGIVQGVRAYDSVTGQWSTPDAYAGDVRDPMSQKPFMWNDNNPVEYQDPTGYDPTIIDLLNWLTGGLFELFHPWSNYNTVDFEKNLTTYTKILSNRTLKDAAYQEVHGTDTSLAGTKSTREAWNHWRETSDALRGLGRLLSSERKALDEARVVGDSDAIKLHTDRLDKGYELLQNLKDTFQKYYNQALQRGTPEFHDANE